MRLLKSCCNGRTVDDGNQEEPQPGWLGIFIKMSTAWEANVLSRAQETMTPTIEEE